MPRQLCSGYAEMIVGNTVQFRSGTAYGICPVCNQLHRAWREGGNNGTGPWLLASHSVTKVKS